VEATAAGESTAASAVAAGESAAASAMPSAATASAATVDKHNGAIMSGDGSILEVRRASRLS
jgi:hypothetical protein